jgi:hypothetical protein
MCEEVKKLAGEHWNYIRDVLMIHGVNQETVYLIGFHYVTAFEHGWKHAIQSFRKGRDDGKE